MTLKRKPFFRIWVPGIPKSSQSKGRKTRYVQEIQDATKKQVPYPGDQRGQALDLEVHGKVNNGQSYCWFVTCANERSIETSLTGRS